MFITRYYLQRDACKSPKRHHNYITYITIFLTVIAVSILTLGLNYLYLNYQIEKLTYDLSKTHLALKGAKGHSYQSYISC